MATAEVRPTTSPEDARKVARTVTKVGNLVKDPEFVLSDKGTAICNARIAVESPVVPGNWAGERKTDFYDIVLFGSLAENFCRLVKGTRVIVTGKPETQTWTGKDGQEHTSKKVLADAAGPDLRWATAVVTKVGKRPGTIVQNGPGTIGYEDVEEEF